MSKEERKSAAKAISESARQIWLAGLGAFAKAQAEGSRVFEQLIREGTELDQKTRKYTKENLQKMREKMEQSTERLIAAGRSTAERLHSTIDSKVEQAVERLAVPTREELNLLAEQLEALTARLGVPEPAKPSASKAKAPAKKRARTVTKAAVKKSGTSPASKRTAARKSRPTPPSAQ